MGTILIRGLLVVLALSAGGEAAAQRTLYRCVVDGRAALSDRPCAGGVGTGLGAIGPARETRSLHTSAPMSVSKASDYLGYLSPVCSELNEGIRNGPARGLGSRALHELQNAYRERCSDDEQNARRRMAEDQTKKREAQKNELLAEKRERERVTLSRDQCDEMYRIAHGRRKKLEAMAAGERADFERFEANWKARCQ